jgi:apolipoprotein N-acyltransferase
VTLCAALLALSIDAFLVRARTRVLGLAIAALAIVGAGIWCGRAAWSAPAGEPVAISLVQGNVAQDLKFDPAQRDETYKLYLDLVNDSRGRLVVLPESAFPVFADEVPDPVLIDLLRTATARRGDVLVGMFTAEPPLPGRDQMRYFNSVVTLGAGEVQLYRKRHLVPFGETIPLEPIVGWFLRAVLSIPISDQSAGDPRQMPLAVAGQKVAMTICYEDAFGGELRTQAAASTLIVNVTNDAWYGRSLAAEQHNQIAAMRALEAARPLVRATNTGITSAFDHDGREIARLPWFTRGILELSITGRSGVTPYVRYGDLIPVLLALALWLVMFAATYRRARRSASPPESKQPIG